MIRRHFIRLMTLAGAASVPAMKIAAANGTQTIAYRVTGFTCVTCAVGLDTMMAREKGVVWSHSNYESGRTVICFHPGQVAASKLQDAIAGMGFLAELLS